MERVLYLTARVVVSLVQALPLEIVARLGRCAGGLFYWVDLRHRRVALANLSRCFSAEKSPAEIRALARENFRRIGESFLCALKTAGMSEGELRQCLEASGIEQFPRAEAGARTPSRVIAIGHFGNFELYAHVSLFAPDYQSATTYRALRQPSLNRLMQSLRAQTGCLYFERRQEGAELKAALKQQRMIVGFLADQSAGVGGVRLPFFGRECSCSPAPAVFALRYQLPLHVGVCYRIGLARWRLEFSDEIPTHQNGQRRRVADITRDINRAFEEAIRRDPANWFWVHNRWKRVPKGVKDRSSVEPPEPVVIRDA
jgi:KDO2-lipid IV(A) lauroyltransferase